MASRKLLAEIGRDVPRLRDRGLDELRRRLVNHRDEVLRFVREPFKVRVYGKVAGQFGEY